MKQHTSKNILVRVLRNVKYEMFLNECREKEISPTDNSASDILRTLSSVDYFRTTYNNFCISLIIFQFQNSSF